MDVQTSGGAVFEVAGEGRTAVVFPGGPARHPEYLEHLGGLDRRGFRLATLYPRGIGASPAPGDPSLYAASRQMADAESVREELGLDRMTLVAHSAGASVALGYAASHPDRLERLVLVTPSTWLVDLIDSEEEWEGQLAKQARQPWYPSARAALDEIEQHGQTPERRAAMLPLLYGAWTPEVQAHAARDPQQSTPEARAHYFDDRPDPAAVRAALGRVACPVRIVVGEVDPGPGERLAGELADLFPEARVTMLPGAGHFGWVTHPEDFADLMVRLLDD